MGYTPTIWKEQGMTPDTKLAGLNNIEQIYSSLKSYLDVYYHDTSYYLKAESDAKFFGSGNDGSGSGLVAEFVDGFTAQQILAMGFPSGGICGWAGSEASIPGGFSPCDGSNATPNLRGKILVAAGGHYSRGDVGGSDTVTTSATITIAGHALTAAEIPLHEHGTITDNYPNVSASGRSYGGSYGYDTVTGVGDTNQYTGYSGSGSTHGHTASWAGTTNQDKRPPYMALCYICCTPGA